MESRASSPGADAAAARSTTMGAQTRHPYSMPEMQSCIAACLDCFKECENCAAMCVGMPDMAECERACQDCALCCEFCVSLMARESPMHQQACGLCADACTRCANECQKFNVEHCRRCAASCRRCEQECRRMAANKVLTA